MESTVVDKNDRREGGNTKEDKPEPATTTLQELKKASLISPRITWLRGRSPVGKTKKAAVTKARNSVPQLENSSAQGNAGFNRTRLDLQAKRQIGEANARNSEANAKASTGLRRTREEMEAKGFTQSSPPPPTPGVIVGSAPWRGLRQGAHKRRVQQGHQAEEKKEEFGDADGEPSYDVNFDDSQSLDTQQAALVIEESQLVAAVKAGIEHAASEPLENMEEPQPQAQSPVHYSTSPVRFGTSDGLAVARLVTEPSNRNLPNAQEVNVSEERKRQCEIVFQQKKTKRITILLALMGTLVVALLVLLLVMFVPRKDVSSSEALVVRDSTPSIPNLSAYLSQAPTGPPSPEAPTFVPTTFPQYVLSLLPAYSQRAVWNEVKPQSPAFDWLINDPNLESYPEWRILQRFALATLYHATNGDEWFGNKNWLSYSVPECYWYFSESSQQEDTYHYGYCLGGLASGSGYYGGTPLTLLSMCDYDDQAFYDTPSNVDGLIQGGNKTQFLTLPNNGLDGTLPAEISLLTSLVLVDLSNNDLKGTINQFLGEIPGLIDMRLNSNRFDAIAENLVMESVTNLNLGNSDLGGRLPATLYQWTSLVHLYLEENSLTGPLPPQLGLCTNLKKLHLFRNQLEIPAIPAEFGSLSMLRELLLASNKLPATIPSEFGLLSSLTSLDVIGTYGIAVPLTEYSQYQYTEERHNWSGTIPTQLGRLTALRSLVLARGRLSGTIPTELALLSSFNHLLLQDNMLTGQIPTELSHMVGLETIDLSNNLLTGQIPTELGRLVTFPEWSPSSITACVEVFRRERRLDECSYYGADSCVDGQCVGDICMGLQELNLSSNLLHGHIPSELGRMILQTCDLSQNKLSGTISPELRHLTSIQTFSVEDNRLTGPLPSGIGLWDGLKKASVAKNRMNGTIAGEIANLVPDGSLEIFNMSENFFTGILPDDLCTLSSNLTFDCYRLICGCSCSCDNNNTRSPTEVPSVAPSWMPSRSAIPTLSSTPSISPSSIPPSIYPASPPSALPTSLPSVDPSLSEAPSRSGAPSAVPSSSAAPRRSGPLILACRLSFRFVLGFEQKVDLSQQPTPSEMDALMPMIGQFYTSWFNGTNPGLFSDFDAVQSNAIRWNESTYYPLALDFDAHIGEGNAPTNEALVVDLLTNEVDYKEFVSLDYVGSLSGLFYWTASVLFETRETL